MLISLSNIISDPQILIKNEVIKPINILHILRFRIYSNLSCKSCVRESSTIYILNRVGSKYFARSMHLILPNKCHHWSWAVMLLLSLSLSLLFCLIKIILVGSGRSLAIVFLILRIWRHSTLHHLNFVSKLTTLALIYLSLVFSLHR